MTALTLAVAPLGLGAALGVSGPHNSLGGWGASEDTVGEGSLVGQVWSSGEGIVGAATNDLGVGLRDVSVVEAGGQSAELGFLASGASASFRLGPPHRNIIAR